MRSATASHASPMEGDSITMPDRACGGELMYRPYRPENDESPAGARPSRGAPKRTRTSTRLARTRPATWRVYQFRHRRGNGEYSPGVRAGLSPSAGGDTVCEHT